MLYLGADHRGFELKEQLKQRLTNEGVEYTDMGDKELQSDDDYVDFAKSVSKKVLEDTENKGLLLCGSGVGMDIVANKFDGIRSALVDDPSGAKQSREHEDINVLSLPADKLSVDQAYEILKVFLETAFSHQNRHQRRLEKIEEIEREN